MSIRSWAGHFAFTAILLLLAPWGRAEPQGLSRQAPPLVTVGYDAAFDLFNLLDNLPDWLPGYTSAIYKEDWERRFGLDAQDRAALEEYARFRQRTSPMAREDDNARPVAERLFAGTDTRFGDPYTIYFQNAASFTAAAKTAIAAQALGDRELLRRYYARFEPRARELLAGAGRFIQQQETLTRELAAPETAAFVARMRAFYGAEAAPVFQVRFVWWPYTNRTQAKLRGGSIVLFSPPRVEDDWAPIVLHEYAHFLSAGQPATGREALAAAFARLCPAALALPNPLNALEEPLAIYWGQYRFERDVRGTTLSSQSSWYVQPHADRAAKAIAAAFPADQPAPVLSEGPLLQAAASVCE